MEKKKVIIIGAGFGGLNAARALKKADVDVLVIDRTNHHLFQPLLYQVATAALPATQIASSIRGILARQKNTRVIMAEVASIDKQNNTVTLDDGESFPFDYLIIATGARHSYFGHPEWEKFAPGLKTVQDALNIRDSILSSFEKAESLAIRGESGDKIDKYLNFVIIGGGPTGVELAGAIAEISRYTLFSNFRMIKPEMAKIYLVEASAQLLQMLSPDLAERAKKDLESLNVQVLTNWGALDINGSGVKIAKFNPDKSIAEQKSIESENVIWAAGNSASPLLKTLNSPLDRQGRAIVEEDLSIPGHSNIFVIGDAASISSNWKDPDAKPLGAVAPLAIQSGNWVAHTIRYNLTKEQRLPFSYFDKGSLATIGKGKAVGSFGKLKFTGLIAWLGWCFVHIAYLIGFRNRISVMLEWFFVLVTGQHGVRLIYKTPKEKE